jgi:hypothetical protein
MKNTEPRKLHRRNAPPTSVIAANSVSLKSGKLLKLVLNEVDAAGTKGITAKEILSKHPKLPYSSITARPTQLEKARLIYYKGDKRNGARIMRAQWTQHVTQEVSKNGK